MILYPGGISETEILLAYGGVHLQARLGNLPAITLRLRPTLIASRSFANRSYGKARRQFALKRRDSLPPLRPSDRHKIIALAVSDLLIDR